MFVSAAEAKWGFDGAFEGTPVSWLHDYLVAKRAVENEVGYIFVRNLMANKLYYHTSGRSRSRSSVAHLDNLDNLQYTI